MVLFSRSQQISDLESEVKHLKELIQKKEENEKKYQGKSQLMEVFHGWKLHVGMPTFSPVMEAHDCDEIFKLLQNHCLNSMPLLSSRTRNWDS